MKCIPGNVGLLLLFFCFNIQKSIGQLCQGSLGDAIVNTTFGAGTNPGAPLNAATTSYQYVSNDCPVDGFYTVRNNSNNCFGSSWHTLSRDHTGDANGFFMLVNASVQPSAFYLDTVRGLCGNSTYEFAAWVMNVLLPSACGNAGIEPNLTFTIERIDGSILQTYNSGNINSTATPTWKQFGFFFTTPGAGADIVLRIVNNSPGGCGNDLALDDITFRPCGPALTPVITGTGATSTSLCEGTAGNFNFSVAVSPGFSNPVYQWQARVNGGTWTDIAGQVITTLNRNFPASALAGNYEFRMAVAESGNMGYAQCRIVSGILKVIINTIPVTSVSNDGPVCENKNVLLTATGGSEYSWTGPLAFTSPGNPLTIAGITNAQAGKYYVTVTNAVGCSRLDSTLVVINPAPAATTAFAMQSICKNDSATLSASGGLTYRWFPVTGLSSSTVSNPKASPAQTTLYTVEVTGMNGCLDSATTNIIVVEKPVINAGPDKIILEGQSVQLSATVNDPTNSIEWSPAIYINDIHALQPSVNPPVDTKYILKAKSVAGCGTASDTMLVKVYKDIFVPNAFSPNSDGTNDRWNIPALEVYNTFDVRVYNRFGQLIFHVQSGNVSWDGNFKGKPQPSGSYVYFINVGNSQDIFKGTLMLIR